MKPAANKRAVPPRPSDRIKAFLKDWEKLSRSGRFDMKRLKEATLLLISSEAVIFVRAGTYADLFEN